jgi:hypothetical protein
MCFATEHLPDLLSLRHPAETGPYTITPAQTGLAAGIYTFTVKDANNCTITVPVTITQPTAITVSASAGNDCM